LTVFNALKETVSPDFVLKRTVAGFFTVLTAANLTVSFAMEISYHRPSPTLAQRTRKKWGTRGETGWNETRSSVI
jgi:hypothetical protein